MSEILNTKPQSHEAQLLSQFRIFTKYLDKLLNGVSLRGLDALSSPKQSPPCHGIASAEKRRLAMTFIDFVKDVLSIENNWKASGFPDKL